MDSGKSAGSDEEHEWLTELCRAGRAGPEPADSDDDWLKELCKAPANSTRTEPRSSLAAELGGDPAGSSPSAESELTAAYGVLVTGLDAEQTGIHRNSDAPRIATAEPRGPFYGARRGPDPERHAPYSRTRVGCADVAMATTAADPVSGHHPDTAAIAEWRDGWAMVLRGGKCVREIAEARASRDTATRGYAGGILQGGSMDWHFQLGPPGGIEWRLMCRRAEATVVERLGRLPTIFKIGITSDPLHRWVNPSYGYYREGYQTTTVLAATTPAWAAALERHLIAWSRSAHGHGRRNDAPGGESSSHEPPVGVYVVTVHVEEFIRWRLARVRALSSS